MTLTYNTFILKNKVPKRCFKPHAHTTLKHLLYTNKQASGKFDAADGHSTNLKFTNKNDNINYNIGHNQHCIAYGYNNRSICSI
ncbi:MAG: hypothetical protein ACD_77C00002G0005 [uncultured bacterium]|nr:MAG: hypothetical protein ACD_77C00002G0005 [uncultured bacterium]